MSKKKAPEDMTLTEIENFDAGEPSEDNTGMVARHLAIRKKPLRDLTPADYRLTLLQQTSYETLVPRALDMLEQVPGLGAEYFEGDLLVSVLHTPAECWKQHPEQAARIEPLISRFGESDPLTDGTGLIGEAVEGFRAGTW